MFARLFNKAFPPTPPHAPTCPCCDKKVNEYWGYTKAYTLNGPATFCNPKCYNKYADQLEKNNGYLQEYRR